MHVPVLTMKKKRSLKLISKSNIIIIIGEEFSINIVYKMIKQLKSVFRGYATRKEY